MVRGTHFGSRFHESANRPHLLAGCETKAISIVFFTCILLGFSIPTRYGICGALFLFFFLQQILREMAKDDPHMIKIFLDHQRYKKGFWLAKHAKPNKWRK